MNKDYYQNISPAGEHYGGYAPYYPSAQAGFSRFREAVIHKLDDNNTVTINNWNCFVWNSANIYIADVDVGYGPLRSTNPSLLTALSAIQRAVTASKLSARLYETLHGFRVIGTTSPMECNDEALQLMEAMLGDPKYVRLCRLGKNYRARLTPKPVGLMPPLHCAVCRYIETIGEMTIPSELAPIIEFHDIATKALSGIRTLV